MLSARKDSLPSPSMEDSFFPLSSSSLSRALPSSSVSPLSSAGEGGRDIETDLILAAELGQALLERNEELGVTLEQREREIETLQQEKHVLQRRLNMSELTLGQREQELTSDISNLRAELERHQNMGRDRKKDESEQLSQLANHNHRLVEQLAEAVTVEHTLRSELRALREEIDDSSFSRNISCTQLQSTQAENRVLQERFSSMEKRLQASQDDIDRLRTEREGLRERLMDLQNMLREREAEVKEAFLAHSTVLEVKEEEIQTLREELQCQLKELQSLREEMQPFRSGPEKPSYSFLENELMVVRQEKESLTQQLLNTIKHKVALSQEVDAWQEDMRLVISQQVQQQEAERKKTSEREKDEEKSTGLQRSRSLRIRGEGGKGFFSSFFREKI